MGVDPYLIAPTLILGVAQRLLRKIAEGAAVPVKEEESVRMMIEKQFSDLPDKFKSKLNLGRDLYDVVGTEDSPTGTKGRVAVLEMFEVDKEVENIILNNPTELAIYDAARKKGMLTLKEAGILKGMDGIVPLSEISTL